MVNHPPRSSLDLKGFPTPSTSTWKSQRHYDAPGAGSPRQFRSASRSHSVCSTASQRRHEAEVCTPTPSRPGSSSSQVRPMSDSNLGSRLSWSMGSFGPRSCELRPSTEQRRTSFPAPGSAFDQRRRRTFTEVFASSCNRSDIDCVRAGSKCCSQDVHGKRIDVAKAALQIAHHKHGPQRPLVQALQQLFDAFDGSKDGVVDVEEFMEGQAALHAVEGVPFDVQKALAAYFDIDSMQNGVIRLQDFKKYQIEGFKALNKGIDEMIDICSRAAEKVELGRKAEEKGTAAKGLPTPGARRPRLRCDPAPSKESIIIQMGRAPLPKGNERRKEPTKVFRHDISRTMRAFDTFIDKMNAAPVRETTQEAMGYRHNYGCGAQLARPRPRSLGSIVAPIC